MKKIKLFIKFLLRIKNQDKIDQLVARGMYVGKNFHCMDGVIIDPTHCFHISFGDNVTLAPNVHILAHDASTKMFLN